MISSASIDVRLSASPYHEIRKQESIGADYLHGKTTYSVGYIHSREPDYNADTTYYSVSQDMFGDLTTVTLGYKRAWDRIYRDICNAPHPTGGFCPDIINDPTFHQQADHRGYSFGLSQILTRNALLDLNYEINTDQGYLANPYREIRYLSPGGLGFTLAPQLYPNTRTSNAASVLLKYYLPWRAVLSAQYRYYHDTWAVLGDTFQLGYTLPAWHRWVFDASLRYYTQSHASFYSDLFPRADYQNYRRATASWPPSTATRSASGRNTNSTSRECRGSTKAAPTCVSTACSSTTATTVTRCWRTSTARATSRSITWMRPSSRRSSRCGSKLNSR